MPVSIPAAERTLDILGAMARAAGPVTAAGLARDLGIPRSSVYQLLDVLVSRGFVTHLPDEQRWTLGLASFEVGSAYLRRDPLERVAQPLLRRLVETTPLPVVAHLGVVRGHETVYLLKEQSDRLVTTITEVGVRLPAALTASGRAVLADLPRAQVRAQMSARGAFVDRTGSGPRSLSALTALLAVGRRQGHAEEDGFITAGYASVAAAICDRDDLPVAAVGITFRSDEVDIAERQRLAAAARRCAADITRRM
ncbi:MAG: IclR family transcriptional regulator [Candidatus Nanopelagicales bacterium]|nr:IclR family transcriptional regulator [Candidatus Nanopelagicales bacterium]MCF8543179.1 IclR family transcriptional regulator [Candidatus Nanopelagicales bacterium]